MLGAWVPSGILEWFILPLLVGLCALYGWALSPTLPRIFAQNVFERLIMHVLVGLIALSWVGTLLAAAGLFRPWVLGGALIATIGLARCWHWRHRETVQAISPDHTPCLASWALGLFLIAAGWAYARPAESFVIPYDAGVYTLGGIVLAREGRLNAREEFLYSFTAESAFPSFWEYLPQGDPFSSRFQEYARQFYELQRGFPPRLLRFGGGPFYTWGIERGVIEIGFPPLAKVWQALCIWLFGEPCGPWAAPFFGVMGLAAFYLFLRRLVGWPTALGAAALLAFSLPQVWFARFPTSDIHTLVLWAGSLAFVVGPKASNAPRASAEATLWGALALGALPLLRLEGLPLAVGLAAFCSWAWAFHNQKRQALIWLLIVAGISLLGTTIVLMVTPIYFLSPSLAQGGALLISTLGIGALAWWRLKSVRQFVWGVWSQGFRGAALVVASGWLLWGLYALIALVARPWSNSLAGWIVQYWTRPALALAVLGGALIAWQQWRHREAPEMLAPVAVSLVLLTVYSRHAHVTPLHPWAMRRLVPLVMPMLALSTSAALVGMVSRGAFLLAYLRPFAGRLFQKAFFLVGIILFGGLVYGIAQKTYPILWHRERQGLYAQLKALDGHFSPRSVVLMGTGLYAEQLAPTMQFLLGHPTFILRQDDAVQSDSPIVARLLANAQAAGRDIFYVATGEAYRPLPQGWALEHAGGQVIRTPILLYPWGHPPNGHDLAIETFLADVYRVVPMVQNPTTSFGQGFAVPLGLGSYPYLLEGFYGYEQPNGHDPYRWTDGRAVVQVPWPRGTELTPLCVEIDASPGRPSQVPLPRIALEAEGTPVGQAAFETAERRTLAFVVQDIQDKDGDGRLTLTLTSDTWVPADVSGSNDARRLGVMLYGITVAFDGTCPAKE